MKKILVDGADCYPSKIICIGRNYAAHIEELNNNTPTEPVIFMKPNSAITNDLYSGEEHAIHYEGEITFMVKDGLLSAVGFGFDLTKRNIQTDLKAQGLPWERAKAFDGSAVFSQFTSLVSSIEHLSMELVINRQVAQKGGFDLMLLKPEDILSEVSQFVTLEDGDLLMTGTPVGVGLVNCGDHFNAKITDTDRVIIEQTWIAK